MSRNEAFTAAEVSLYYAIRAPRVRQQGNEWRGPCPIHQGTNDSFAVKPESGQWTCHSKCGRSGSLFDLEMALAGLDFQYAKVEVDQIMGRANRTKLGRIVATYDYTDECGKLLYQCVRYDPKDFRQRRPDGRGGWLWHLRGTRLVLYRLQSIVSAETVLVVEGERDVHTLVSLGFVATCNPMGAGKWRDEYSEQLRGKAVILFGDNDEPGRRRANQVGQSLVGVASTVSMVTVPIGKDVSEWVAAGATRDVIEAAIHSNATQQCEDEGEKHRRVDDSADSEAELQYSGHSYVAHKGSLYVWKTLREGHKVPIKIANFIARITADHVADDGTEQFRMFTVQAEMAGRTITVDIPAKDFKAMNWIVDKLGAMAIVQPGQSEHTRTAIQTLSDDIPHHSSYIHTGWRTIDGANYYLHGGGAIGDGGNRADIRVSLEDKLPNYRLPDPPRGNERIAAVRASLRMLDVTLDRLTFPVYAAIFRSILGPATFSVHMTGSSGGGKSQLAALAQQHFGSGMDADNLPASWSGTANATSALAFYAKDAILVVDDFVPAGNAASQQKLHGEADRLLRAQGNSAGRRRLSSDGRLLGNRPPRGLILSTGEDTPRGRSLNARLVLLRFPKGVMNWRNLSVCQELAAGGEFAKATSAFVKWLSPRLQGIQQEMRDQRFLHRKIVSDPSCLHMRTPENLNALHLGFTTVLNFARSAEAISTAEAQALADRAKAAFREIEIGEAMKHTDSSPARIFLRLIRSAITMGKAHLAAPNGKAPEGEKPWGWCASAGFNEKQSRGIKIGWSRAMKCICFQMRLTPWPIDLLKSREKSYRVRLKPLSAT